jgi:hypothetical protein
MEATSRHAIGASSGFPRRASYAAGARGEIPTIRVGGRIFAVVAAIKRRLAEAGNKVAAV